MSSSAIGQSVLRLRLIGKMGAWTVEGKNILPPDDRTRALFAAIALAGPRPALRARVTELLWSGEREDRARASLRQQTRRLAEILVPTDPEILRVTRDYLSLAPGAAWIDVAEIMRATPDHPEALSLLDGELLEDLGGIDPSFDIFLGTWRDRLSTHARAVAEALVRAQTQPDGIILAARRLLRIDRAQEGAWRTLMRAYNDLGEPALAIQAFEACRAALADLLDVHPSEQTRNLLNQIRRAPRRPGRPKDARDETPGSCGPGSLLKADPHGGRRSHVGIQPIRGIGLSGEQALFGQDLAGRIANALSRFRWILVLPPAEFARGGGEPGSLRETLGLDLVLVGTAQRNGDEMRISLRLQDLASGDRIVWTRRFDRPAGDLGKIADEVAADVAGEIAPLVLMIEAKRAAARPEAIATANDLMGRATVLMSVMERETFPRAGPWLERAIAQEPDHAGAHALWAIWHVLMAGQGWVDDRAAAMTRAGELAERAIVLDPEDAKALTIAGHVRMARDQGFEAARALHDRALALNPNLGMAWALSAADAAGHGEVEDAARRFKRYRTLSPANPHAGFYDVLGATIHFMGRDYHAAVTAARAVTRINSNCAAAYRTWLAALGYLGQTREIETISRRLLTLEPDFSIACFLRTTMLRRPADRDHFVEGLRRAGIT